MSERLTWQELAEIEADRRCLDIETNDELYEVFMDYCNPIKEIENLHQENEKLRKRLEFYVSPNFMCNECDDSLEICEMCKETEQTLKEIGGSDGY